MGLSKYIFKSQKGTGAVAQLLLIDFEVL